MSCLNCGFNCFECYDDGTEICRQCGTPKPVKSVYYIDVADYSIVLGKIYPTKELKAKFKTLDIGDTVAVT